MKQGLDYEDSKGGTAILKENNTIVLVDRDDFSLTDVLELVKKRKKRRKK